MVMCVQLGSDIDCHKRNMYLQSVEDEEKWCKLMFFYEFVSLLLVSI